MSQRRLLAAGLVSVAAAVIIGVWGASTTGSRFPMMGSFGGSYGSTISINQAQQSVQSFLDRTGNSDLKIDGCQQVAGAPFRDGEVGQEHCSPGAEQTPHGKSSLSLEDEVLGSFFDALAPRRPAPVREPLRTRPTALPSDRRGAAVSRTAEPRRHRRISSSTSTP